jgi:hypothetical protein
MQFTQLKKMPRLPTDQDDPELKERVLLFNDQYKKFLHKLNKAFNGHPERLTVPQEGVFAKEMRQIAASMEPRSFTILSLEQGRTQPLLSR